MNSTDNNAAVSTLRLIETRNKESVGKDYKSSYEVKEDNTGQSQARCDLYKKSLFSKLMIRDHRESQWEMRPSRRIMPTRWLLKSPDGVDAFEIRLPGWLFMLNPLGRTYLYLKDIQTGQEYRFIDLQSSLGDRFFRSPVTEWSITERGRVLATITRLSREREEPVKKGFFAKLKNLFTDSDWGLLTPGTEPLLAAPVFMGLMLVYEEVSNVTE